MVSEVALSLTSYCQYLLHSQAISLASNANPNTTNLNANSISKLNSSSASGTTRDDSTNPYLLRSGDNPGNVLRSQLLIGDNYPTWSRTMLLTLTIGFKCSKLLGLEKMQQFGAVMDLDLNFQRDRQQ